MEILIAGGIALALYVACCCLRDAWRRRSAFANALNAFAKYFGYEITWDGPDGCVLIVYADERPYAIAVTNRENTNWTFLLLSKTPPTALTFDIQMELAQRSRNMAWGSWMLTAERCVLQVDFAVSDLSVERFGSLIQAMIGEVVAFDRRMAGASPSVFPKIAPA